MLNFVKMFKEKVIIISTGKINNLFPESFITVWILFMFSTSPEKYDI